MTVSPGWGTRPQSNFLHPSLVGTKSGGLGKRTRLVGNDGFESGLFTLGTSGILHAFSTIDGVRTGGAGGIVEDGRLGASIQPHDWGWYRTPIEVKGEVQEGAEGDPI
jgi:hypothetical protein